MNDTKDVFFFLLRENEKNNPPLYVPLLNENKEKEGANIEYEKVC